MNYIDGQYLLDKYPQVVKNLGGYPNDSIDLAINEASAEIDLYISKWLPLVVVPEFIPALCADIAMYRVKQDEATEIDVERYNQALDTLKEIRDGLLSLAQVASANSQDCLDSSSYGNTYLSSINTSAY